MRQIFAILDPIIFPIEIPFVFCIEAIRLTTNSGREVPKDTIESPIITGLTPNPRANAEEFLINSSAPTHNKVRPKIRIINCISIN
jgi:hypothetical protein